MYNLFNLYWRLAMIVNNWCGLYMLWMASHVPLPLYQSSLSSLAHVLIIRLCLYTCMYKCMCRLLNSVFPLPFCRGPCSLSFFFTLFSPTASHWKGSNPPLLVVHNFVVPALCYPPPIFYSIISFSNYRNIEGIPFMCI